MKGYVFTYGVDGFDADTAPAHEIGVYLDFDKAFKKLVELNHKAIQIRIAEDWRFYEDGYGEGFHPDDDWEAIKAEKEGDWELFDMIIEKHRITDEIEINKLFVNEKPLYDMYAIEEIEIIE